MRKITFFIAGFVLSFLALFWYYERITSSLPPPEEKLPPSARIVYPNGKPFYISRSVWMNLEDFPRDFIEMLLASEDRNFYRHAGIDLKGIIRAAIVNLLTGRIVQGGSTITQQLARSLYLGFSRSFERKIKEIFIAIWLERIRSKEEILEMYLNSAYVGNGLYGFGAASLYYFGREIGKLSRAEMAVLIGVIKSPETFNPYKNPEAAKKKAKTVALAMKDAGIIDEKGFMELCSEIDSLEFRKPRVFFDEEVFWRIVEEVKELTGLTVEELREGYEIVVTLDESLQRTVMEKVGEGMAFLAVDSSGRILAYKGKGVRFGRRQIGSAIKPMYYLYALLHGHKPKDLLPDVPIDVAGWKPENFTKRFRGYSTLENALVWSRNVPSVFLFHHLGYRNVVSFIKDTLKIGGRYPRDMTLALGTLETSLEEIAKFYTALSNGGTIIQPTIIEEVRRTGGGPVYVRIPKVLGKIPDGLTDSHTAVFLLKGILEEVVRRGTGKKAKLDGKVIFGKTGTAERNAWFIGGDDSVIMILTRDGEELLGGRDVAPLWKEIAITWGGIKGRVSSKTGGGGKPIMDERDVKLVDFKRLSSLLENGSIPLGNLERFLSKVEEETLVEFLESLRKVNADLADEIEKVVREMRGWRK